MGEDIKTIGNGTRTERGSSRIDAAKQQRAEEVMSSRKFKSAITRAHNYTEDNYHGEARKTIATAFGYSDLADGYKQINKEHNATGNLGKDLYDRRNRLDNEMEKRIRKDYGEKGIKAYNRGLS